jgi:hypothetical protein
LDKARGKADEISFLICDIDEADRLNDRQRALKKAESLLKVKPGHHRAIEVQGKYSGYGEGGAARIGVLDQFRRPLNDGGWIPWSVLAFGLAVFGVMTGVIVIYLNRTAVGFWETAPHAVFLLRCRRHQGFHRARRHGPTDGIPRVTNARLLKKRS